MYKAFLCSAAIIGSVVLPSVAKAISVSATLVNPSACGAPTGAIEIQVWGGTGPYAFEWSNGATTANIYDLLPGIYSITVTDANADEATGSWEVVNAGLSLPQCAQDGHCSCIGSMGGQVQIIEWLLSGTPPYTYNPPPDGFDAQGDPYFSSFGSPAGSIISIEVTDANGCTGISNQTVLGPAPTGGPYMQLVGTTGSCTGTSGGSVTVSNLNDPIFFLNPYPQITLLDAAQVFVTAYSGANNTTTFSGLAPGNYTIVRDWDPTDYLMAYNCDGNPYDVLAFTVADLGSNCGSLSGSVFIDNDDDCIQDPTEVGVPYQVLEIEPGGLLAITNGIGDFALDLPSGNYTLAQTDPALIQQCPVNSPVPFAMGTVPVLIDLADSSTVQLDLSTQLESGPMRPGFAGSYWGWVRNLSPQVSAPVTITFILDADLTYTNATPTPTSIAGNTLTWDLAPFTALQGLYINVNVGVPMGILLGTPLSTSLAVVNTLPDDDMANNTAVSIGEVVGSYDPNDKRATTSTRISEELYFINEDEWIDYTIRFQNTGTFPAEFVVITDTIAPELNMLTFEQGVASHPFTVSFKPDRVIEWRFENIQLPASSTDEAGSHGLVKFRVKPLLPLVAGTIIENTAIIYFDFNDPVITEPSVLVAELSTGVDSASRENLRIAPNPVSELLLVDLPTNASAEVVLRSSDGRRVEVPQHRVASGLQLDVRGLANGIYILQHLDRTVRFIKQ